MKPIVLAMDNHSARLGFPCGAEECEETDCVHLVMYLDSGDADLELAPFWQCAAVLGPHGDNLREHDRQDLMHRAMEEMDARADSLMRKDGPPLVVASSRGFLGTEIIRP